jgi:hypothetical protein
VEKCLFGDARGFLRSEKVDCTFLHGQLRVAVSYPPETQRSASGLGDGICSSAYPRDIGCRAGRYVNGDVTDEISVIDCVYRGMTANSRADNEKETKLVHLSIPC